MKTSNKKNRTSKKPMFIVDLTNVDDARDVVFEFTMGKVRAGLPITENELMSAINYSIDYTLSILSDAIVIGTTFCGMCENCKKQTPWYKRVWNWIKKPFVKK